MIGWFRIIFNTKNWDDNKEIICKVIKPLIEKFDKTGDIVNFFFLQYPYPDGQDPPRVKFWFYGKKRKVINEIKKYQKNIKIEKFDPASQDYRFQDDYPLGIKLFELGSRLALCSIDNKNLIDKTGPTPMILTLRHAFLQNLGYIGPDESAKFPQFDPFLLQFFHSVKQTKIK